MATNVLDTLDRERRRAGERSRHGDIVKEYSPDGSECLIVYSHCTAHNVDHIIRSEVSLAIERRYTLEWKVYGHDTPPALRERLLIGGFEPGPVESFMVLPVNAESLAAFSTRAFDIKRIHDSKGLSDVAAISREIGRHNVEEEEHRLTLTLQNNPEQMSVYVGYVDGEPAACGRIYFKDGSDLAELCGGRTKTTYRYRGLYTALVAVRLREALKRNRTCVYVDALPTSEPILRKRGFQFVTTTQPFVYELRT